VPEMMTRGVQQMDALLGRWLAAGQLSPAPSLIVPEPPVIEEPVVEEAPKPVQQAAPATFIQVHVTSPYSPVGWLRSIPGVLEVREFGSAIISVRYRGSPAQLSAALAARGWRSDTSTGVFRITGYAPAQPASPAPAPQPAPTPAPQPDQPATNTVQPAPGGAAD